MRKQLSSRSGFSLVGVVAAMVCLGIALWVVSDALKGGQHPTQSLRDQLIAEASVTELLETFRSMSGTEFANYLAKNPNDTAAPPYQLCAHINIIDRSEKKNAPLIINPDPNVVLGSTILGASEPHLSANRFYFVEVVDIVTVPPVKKNYCDKIVSTAIPQVPPDPNLYYAGSNPSERFLITVGVSWHSSVSRPEMPERVAYSTILPNW